MWELVLFILVGSIGGLVGAWFNGTNERLSIFRAKNIKTRGLRGEHSESTAARILFRPPPPSRHPSRRDTPRSQPID